MGAVRFLRILSRMESYCQTLAMYYYCCYYMYTIIFETRGEYYVGVIVLSINHNNKLQGDIKLM